ncbi:hypothetical protein DSM109990_02162 [Sulfitobacter dubius]|uniref:Type IV pilus biogenesis protein PilP n=2 Tax=Roseobacteraceae TaxID=2854170 RepID=A0ABY3ZKZ2_9RHOB|nr:hypothetical protein DSM109990_02162 [Sulfitobacter dubius]
MLKSSTMKPNFTLSLSFDGIRLLHRTAGGWRLVGEVALDSTDLPSELAVLRKTATALDSGGLRSLLLIPDAQIKYLTIDTPGADSAARRAAAAAALEGATPYAVADLVFDVSADGTQTHVAAVARETLEEAEAFAVEHRFHPVSFAAAPAAHPFDGAPHFGATKAASELLEPGESVEPEAAAIVITGVMSAPEGPIADTNATTAVADVPAAQQPEPELAPTPEDTPPPVEEDLPELAAPEQAPDPSHPAELEATPDDVPPPLVEDLPDLDAPVETAEASAGSKGPELAPTPAETPPPLEEDLPELDAPTTGAAADTPEEPEETSPPAIGSVAASAAPLAAAAKGESETPAPPTARPEPSRKVDFSAPPSRSAPAAGFASRRGGTDNAPNLGGASRATPPPPPAAKPDTKPNAGPNTAPNSTPAPSTASLPVGAPSPAAAPLAPQMPVEPATVEAATEAAAPAPDSSSLTPNAQSSVGGFLSRRKPKPSKDRRSAATAPNAASPSSEAERMTVFGARRRNEVGGKPRFLGLILTAALLVFLAGVAAWASIFLDEGNALSRLFGDRSPRSTAEALAPADTPTSEDAITALPPEPTEPDAIETAALDAGLTDEDGAVLDALRDPQPRPITEMTEAEIDAKYATTGIWARAPDVPPAPAAAIDIDDLYLTSIDPISTTTDAVALPPASGFGTDTAPGTVSSPAAAGTVFALDAQGLVKPTAQGAMSPDGHLVYLGRPAVEPPATLTRPEVAPTAPEVDNTLAETRPRTRPDDLEETNERAQLDGLTRTELAGLRPQLRPKSVQEEAEEALAAAAPEVAIDPIDTSDAVAAALAPLPAIQNATKQATTQSRRPDTRPRNFDRIVKRAARSPEPAQVASVAPKAVQPRFPSKTSVAKQATVKNAINLRDVNLIGVYGKPSNRRALIRLSNGRYQKVEVGDRIDGGRVSAIGDSELRYVRRGRNVVLRMPN